MVLLPSLELISFRLCPFVQRAAILLTHKQVKHTVTFIDLANPPTWFREISPRGKVPVLRVNNEVSIFESAVIAEFIDEVTPPPLMPDDPVLRAHNRSWIAYAPTVLMPLREFTTVPTGPECFHLVQDFQTRLKLLEEALGPGPYFNGQAFSLVDAAYAPLFVRLDYFHAMLGELAPSMRFPKVAAWHHALCDLASVQKTIGYDFTQCMNQLVAKRQGYLATLLPPNLRMAGPAQEY